MSKRLSFSFFCFVIFWLFLLVRIFDLSVLKNEKYQELAMKNILREEAIAPFRG